MINAKNILQTLSVAVILACLNSCEKHTTESEGIFAESRTILMYVAADNNGLTTEAQIKLDAVRDGWKPKYGRLLMFVDRNEGSPVLMEAKIKNNLKYNDTLNTYKLQNSASAELFKQVLKDMKRVAPSKSYGLILFSHGTGWLPSKAYSSPALASVKTLAEGTTSIADAKSRTITVDGSDEMEIADFADAIDDNLFDFILFEACFMSGSEVAYELRNKSRFIVASSAEIVRPGFFLIYGQFMPMLYRPKAELERVAQLYYTHSLSLSGTFQSATISVIDCAALEPLADVCAQVINSTMRESDLATIQCYDRQRNRLFFDLGDYINQLASPTQKIAFDIAMNNCIVYKANTKWFMINDGGYQIKSHSGLTTYIKQSQFSKLNTKYDQLQWAKKIQQPI